MLGGLFGEGIDLSGNELIGAVIVSPGLPGISLERELIRDHFDRAVGAGFDFAYRYPGMNKVVQAAGRVIRGEKDRGITLFVGDRFASPAYRALLPRPVGHIRQWTNADTLHRDALQFWNSDEKK